MVFDKKNDGMSTVVGFNIFDINCDEGDDVMFDNDDFDDAMESNKIAYIQTILDSAELQYNKNNKIKYQSKGIIEACHMFLNDVKQYLDSPNDDYFIGDEMTLFCKKNIMYQKNCILSMISDYNTEKHLINELMGHVFSLYNGEECKGVIMEFNRKRDVRKLNQELIKLNNKKIYFNKIVDIYTIENKEYDEFYPSNQETVIEDFLTSITERNNRIIDEEIKYVSDKLEKARLEYAMRFINKKAHLDPIKSKFEEYLF